MFDLYKKNFLNILKIYKYIQITKNYKISEIQIYVYYRNFNPEIVKIFEI